MKKSSGFILRQFDPLKDEFLQYRLYMMHTKNRSKAFIRSFICLLAIIQSVTNNRIANIYNFNEAKIKVEATKMWIRTRSKHTYPGFSNHPSKMVRSFERTTIKSAPCLTKSSEMERENWKNHVQTNKQIRKPFFSNLRLQFPHISTLKATASIVSGDLFIGTHNVPAYPSLNQCTDAHKT